MLKKIFNVLLVMMTLVGVSGLAFADTNETVSNQTEEIVDNQVNETIENEIVSDVVKLKLLRLGIVVESHIEGGNVIIDELAEENVTVDYDKLNEIITEFESLLTDINNVDYTQDVDFLEDEYESLKDRAVDLTDEFRDLVKDAVSDEAKAQIREEYRNKKEEVRENRNAKLNEFKKGMNFDILRAYTKELDIDADELIQKVENGEMTFGEAQSMIREQYNELSAEEKRELKDKAHKEIKELRESKKEEAKKIKEEFRAEHKKQIEIWKQEREENREKFKKFYEDKREEFKKIREGNLEEFKEKRKEFNNMSESEIKQGLIDALNLNETKKEELEEFAKNATLEEFRDYILQDEELKEEVQKVLEYRREVAKEFREDMRNKRNELRDFNKDKKMPEIEEGTEE